ncbi:MAG TPA: glutamine--fructose-6-phosphate transaminase (isomerizing) [Actinomycetes bacterium]|jgi:glucosamine--fructose-6-phosphate aminotransferase (isomerizing)|nr:glutamine--fructose-6-phosphate transaminase (isomerizing) [Actinomycetes bacterium]
MCGIVGYAGRQAGSPEAREAGSPEARQALPVLLAGLRRLEYRGYDSAGVAVLHRGRIRAVRKAGKLEMLERELGADDALPGRTGIGHTRWATHGRPTDANAHPHLDCTGRVAVIHNGIIENFLALRNRLEADGHALASQTDTECVAHLIEAALAKGLAFPDAVRSVLGELEGSFALAVLHAGDPETVVGARRDLPLVAGRADGQGFVASDFAAFLDHTRDGVILDDDQVVVVTPDRLEVTDLHGDPVIPFTHHVDWDVAAAEKGGYEHFMRKEIHEQPLAVKQTLEGRTDLAGRLVLDELRMSEDELREIDKVFVVACGSAYHAGLVARYAIEHWARLPVGIEMASEFRYRDPVLDRHTLVIAISQSGETADTLAAVRYARRQRARVLTVCNTVGASIPRDSDAVLYTRAGPEVCVAATKTFAAQLVAVYLVALYLAEVRGTMFPDEVAAVVAELQRIPGRLAACLEREAEVRAVAERHAKADGFLFVGRHVGYPMALEGALKLKETGYVHAQGFPAGELKHGPIALVEEGTPVVVVHPSSHVYAKTVTNMREVAARGAAVVAVAEDGDPDVAAHAADVLRVPPTTSLLSPLLTLVPLQLFAYHVAAVRGCPIDKPRNLAKSVTVE